MTEPTDPTERIPTTERVSRSERVETADPVAAERAWWQNAWLLLPLVLLVLLLLVGLLAVRPEALQLGTDDETTTTVHEGEEAVVTTEPEVPTTATTEATTTTAEPTWREVARLEGSSQKRGELFTLPEGDARLRYESRANVFSVYVVEEGDSLEESDGAPEVTCSGDCADETRLAKGPGEYYLEVNASGGAWTVVVEVLT